MPNEDVVMDCSYDPGLVALSVLISVLAAHATRDLSERVRNARGLLWLAWLLGGATASGIATWSMHYTGMLAIRLPVPVKYDWPTVLLSLLVGVVGSAAALVILSRSKLRQAKALAGGIFMGGVGIPGLHFTGMEAMRLQGMHHYSPGLVTLSVVLSIVISWIALLLIFLFRDGTPRRRLQNYLSTLLLGAANPVMHYTAMAAVTFTPSDEVPALSHAVSISSLGILGISIVPAMVIVVALLTSLVDRLQKQRALLDELFEQAPQAVALMNLDHRVVRVNREYTRVFGYTPEEALGRSLVDLTVPNELRDEEQKYADLVAHGQRVDVETVRRRKDGRRLHVAIVRVPVSVPGGQVGIYAIYQDITERKQAEVALRDLADRLKTLSHRLLEVQETERRNLARELHDEVGQILTGLRLILRPIDDWPGEARARFEQARGVVDELLERIRGLSFDLRPAVLDLLGVLPALLTLFERFTGQSGVQVDFKHEGLDERFSPGVETTVYRIVQEGLTNVARHADVGGVTVRIWATADRISLQVEDRGRGFDPEVVLATSRSSGLAGMRERVELLGGHLTIESTHGAETLLTAELPLHGKSGRRR